MSETHYIGPGGFVTGKARHQEFSTILGSCVSVVLWHPASRFYAICHYLMASSKGKVVPVSQLGRYGDLVLPHFVKLCRQQQIKPADTLVYLLGGASSPEVSQLAGSFQIGKTNIAFARQFLAEHGFSLCYDNTGGNVGRKIYFDTSSGDLQLFFLQQGGDDAEQ